MRITIDQVCKSFGTTRVLQDIHLEIQDRELFFLLGPSGCGKTTLLRMLAGFSAPDSGRILFNDQLVNAVPPQQRNTGMVFQNYALWPHMTVAQNVAYGLEMRRIARPEIDQRVAEALSVVRMSGFASRSPNELSGGQQQRVALARALVVKPDILFLDEPLSNLDARLRLEMRDEIRRIHAETRITTVYVTHDQKESLSLADRIAVLHEGRIAQIGTPQDIYRRPASRFVADFIGETNWMEGTIRSSGSGRVTIDTVLGLLDASAATPALGPGTKVWLGFRPESVRFDATALNRFEATIRTGFYLGESWEYRLGIAGGSEFKALELNAGQRRPTGTMAACWIHPDDVLVLPR